VSPIFATPLTVAAALVLGAVVPAAAQQTSQDYSTLPGYSARPPGMCWHRYAGRDLNGTLGYWAACTNTSGNQSANSARAQAHPPQRYQSFGAVPSRRSVQEPLYMRIQDRGFNNYL
jgi:hypothetical protein